MPNLQATISNQLSATAAQTTLSIQELVSTMRSQGMADQAIRQTLLNDLNSGGQLFGSFRNKLKNTVKNGVELNAKDAVNTEYKDAGVQNFQWISVGDNKVCIDCEERHRETGTLEFFETIGLPASGFSVCQTNCRCQIVPEDYKGENLDKPLVKDKKQNPLLRNMAGKHNSIEDADKWINKNLGLKYSSLKNLDLKTRNKLNKTFKKHLDNNAKINLRQVSIRPIKGTMLAYADKANGLVINSKTFLSNPKFIKDKLSKSVKNGWFHRGSSNFESVISHELGHNLSFKHIDLKGKKIIVKSPIGQKLKDLHSEYTKDMIAKKNAYNKSWIASGKSLEDRAKYWKNLKGNEAKIYEEIFGKDFISQYGGTDIMEWIAEAYSMAYHTSNPSKYALQVRRLLDG